MILVTAFLATALFATAMLPPDYDDCEVVTAGVSFLSFFLRRKLGFGIIGALDLSDAQSRFREFRQAV